MPFRILGSTLRAGLTGALVMAALPSAPTPILLRVRREGQFLFVAVPA